MKKRMAVLVLTLGAAWGSVGIAAAATVTIACSAVGIEYRLCRDGAEAWAARTGNRVSLIQTPNLANERLALFQQLLSTGSSDIDVFQIDVIWPGILGRYFIDLRPYVDAAERGRFFPSMIENNMVDGELKALPWFADVGLLYYRKDLLEKHGLAVPTTWAELQQAAATVTDAEARAGDTRLFGFVFQGKAYEGLTCNALEWIASFGGGRILAPDGSVDFDNPRAIKAVDTAAGWIGGIASVGVLNYAEEEARGVFQSGHAVFMRNWPYAWALVNGADSPVRGKVGVARLPKGGADGRHASALGGAGLAVSRYSRVPKLAADLVRSLTGREEQTRRAELGAFNPTRPALYSDAALLEARPFLAQLQPMLHDAVPRPARLAGDKYSRLSAVFWNAVHDTLSGRGSAADNFAAAQRRLERLHRGGRW